VVEDGGGARGGAHAVCGSGVPTIELVCSGCWWRTAMRSSDYRRGQEGR
jgi:hypothetical protein